MPSNKIRIIFRVEGNSKVGMGHLVRCLALSGQIKKNCDCAITFLMKNSDRVVKEILKCGYETETQLPKEFVDIVIVSLPQISQNYLLKLRKKAKLLVSLDDSFKRRFSIEDIVVRGSIVPELRRHYPCRGCKFLLGPDFMILNKKFQKFNRKNKRINSQVKLILITMGGSDINNLTPKVMVALDKLNKIAKTVVVGPVFEHIDKLKLLSKNYTFVYGVSNMAGLMFLSDIAIAGGGMNLYELASVGTPGVILSQTEYQLREAKCFEEKGAIINLGLGKDATKEMIVSSVEALLKNREKRRKMSQAGKKIIDGKGQNRVANEILETLKTV